MVQPAATTQYAGKDEEHSEYVIRHICAWSKTIKLGFLKTKNSVNQGLQVNVYFIST